VDLLSSDRLQIISRRFSLTHLGIFNTTRIRTLSAHHKVLVKLFLPHYNNRQSIPIIMDPVVLEMLKAHMETIIHKSKTNIQNVVQNALENIINTIHDEMTNTLQAQRQVYENELKTLHAQEDPLHQEQYVWHPTKPSSARPSTDERTVASNSAGRKYRRPSHLNFKIY